MAAPTIPQAGAGAAIGNTPVLVPFTASVDAGSLLIIHVYSANTANDNVTTIGAGGWDKIAEDLSAGIPGVNAVWVRKADGTESGTVSIANTGNTVGMYGRMYRVPPGEWLDTGTLTDAFESIAAVTTSTGVLSVFDVGVTTLGPDRLACNFIALRDDNTINAIGGETGGDWVEAFPEFTSTAGGIDGCLSLQTATMASAGTINGGSATQSGSDPFAVIGLAIKPAAVPDPPRQTIVVSNAAVQRAASW